jgi:hypothetical protein
MANTSRTVCPACGQGWVEKVRVKSNAVLLFVCEECESAWFHEGDVGSERVLSFVVYMESRGLRGLWSEVELVPRGDSV